LQFLDEPVALVLVVLGGPVVVQVVEELDAAVEFVDEAAEGAGAANGFDGIHGSRRQDVFEEVEARVGDGLDHVR
jgi:ethanolamine utilization microcompartment shell protein EutL